MVGRLDGKEHSDHLADETCRYSVVGQLNLEGVDATKGIESPRSVIHVGGDERIAPLAVLTYLPLGVQGLFGYRRWVP